MASPAKRVRLATGELELLDLDDDVLIEIIDKLDHKSKMQLSGTCKRFEGLIGTTFQFYKNFRLELCKKIIPIEPHYCKNIRRKFGTVMLDGDLDGIYGSEIVEIIKNIGANVLKLGFRNFEVMDVDFLKLIRFMPALRELSTFGSRLVIHKTEATPIQPSDVDFKLTRLKVLSSNLDLGNFYKLIPNSFMSKLEFFGRKNRIGGASIAEILSNQKNLEILILYHHNFNVFQYHPSNCHIKRLQIFDLEFPVKSGFEKFSDFMKIQQSVTNLLIKVSENEVKRNDYTEMLTHLLSSNPLNRLFIQCKLSDKFFTEFSKINVCNPTLKNLIIADPSPEDLKKLPTLFPNVTDLTIHWEEDELDPDNFYMDLKSINSMKKLKKFEMDYLTEAMFAELDLNELQEFRMTLEEASPFTEYSGFWNEDSDELVPNEILEDRSTNWRTFVNNNRQLVILDMSESTIPVELLQIMLENLSLLKKLRVRVSGCNFSSAKYRPEYTFEDYLELYIKKQAKKTAKLIGENYDRLEHFMLVLYEGGWHIAKYLKKYYPNVRIEKRAQDDISSSELLRENKKSLKVVILLC
jgi:hypothetical protein